MTLSLSLFLVGASAAVDPLAGYKSCVRAKAAKVGTPSTITELQAGQIVSACRPLLRPAAEWLVKYRGYRTNAPAHMQSPDNLVRAASFDIEHQAKMSISRSVLALSPR